MLKWYSPNLNVEARMESKTGLYYEASVEPWGGESGMLR